MGVGSVLDGVAMVLISDLARIVITITDTRRAVALTPAIRSAGNLREPTTKLSIACNLKSQDGSVDRAGRCSTQR